MPIHASGAARHPVRHAVSPGGPQVAARAAFTDQRSAAAGQRRLNALAGNSAQAAQLRATAQMMGRAQPAQLFRKRNDGEALADYANVLQNEAGRLMNEDAAAVENGATPRANLLYLLECRKSVTTAKQANVFLDAAVEELRKAIAVKTYAGELEAQGYALSGLAGDQSKLTADDLNKINLRIAAMNANQSSFSLHIGVGNVPTMDVTSTSLGGSGRGNVRLQFLGGGKMALVGHNGKSHI